MKVEITKVLYGLGLPNTICTIWSVSRITVILFFVCEVDIMSHLINETPCGPYHPAVVLGSSPDKGTEIMQAVQHSQKIKLIIIKYKNVLKVYTEKYNS